MKQSGRLAAPPLSHQPRILLLQFKRLGDALLAEPVVRSLRAAGWHTTWLDRRGNLPAARLLSADEVRLWPDGLQALRELRYLRSRGFDVVLDLGGTDRCGFVGAFSGARKKIAFARFAQRPFHRWGGFSFVASKVWNQHTVDHFLNLLTPFNVPVCSPRHPQISLAPKLTPELRKKVPDFPPEKSYVVLHLGAARPEKFWPTERWAAVAEHLTKKRGLGVVLTGGSGPAETAARAFLRERLPGILDLGGRTTLEETAAVYAGARLVVTVDSMSAHLAPAVGARTLVLFGPMNPAQWGPRQAGCRALRGGHAGGEFLPTDPPGTMEALTTETVLMTIGEMLTEAEPP